jgi:hypothetical protein
MSIWQRGLRGTKYVGVGYIDILETDEDMLIEQCYSSFLVDRPQMFYKIFSVCTSTKLQLDADIRHRTRSITEQPYNTRLEVTFLHVALPQML